MNFASRSVAVSATLLALSAVILAALGSHLIDMKGMLPIWEKASLIHLFNSAALIGLTALLVQMNSRYLLWGAWLIIAGTVVFSGSIYLHVFTGYQLPNVAPSGGILMMAGWLLAVVAFLKNS